MNKVIILMIMVLVVPVGFAYNWTNTTVNSGGSYTFDLDANGCSCVTHEMIYVECRAPDINNTINQTSLYMTNFWTKYEKCLLEVNSFDKDEDRCIDATGDSCYNSFLSYEKKVVDKNSEIIEERGSYYKNISQVEQDRDTEISAKNTRIKNLEESLGKCGQDKDDEIANVQNEASTQRIVWGAGGILLGAVGHFQYQKRKEKEEGKRSGGLPKPFI